MGFPSAFTLAMCSLLNSTSHRLADNLSMEIYFDSLGFRQLVLHFGFDHDAT